MQLIQELPVTTKAAEKPGWAYVPDTGHDPSRTPLMPSPGKRSTRNVSSSAAVGGAAGGDRQTARQRSKVAQHLASLDRENHRDVQIVLPGKPKDFAIRGLRGHTTPGVKKILQSNKTFANHLADEEAALANQTQSTSTHDTASARTARGTSSKATARPSSSRRVSAMEPMDVDSEPPPDPTAEATPRTGHDEWNPLLRTGIPPAPTEEEIERLLSAPPLSYSAAAAAPTASTAPPRQFCAICGYWGRARCMKCGERICGLECKRTHEETSCAKFWL